ncbi:MAG: hypothetical protein Q9214_000591, partial [Letrouitia sp. 1 TL-2023]
NALLMSMLAASGPINWSKVILPPGRTQQACYLIYYRALQDAEKSAWWGYGKKGGDAKNKSSGVKENGTAKGTKRGRAKKGAELEDDDEESDYKEKVAKKLKLEDSESGSETAEKFERPEDGAVGEI